MEKTVVISFVLMANLFVIVQQNKHNLTINVNALKNSKGTVLIALYNQEGSIPDENFEAYYKKKIASISNNKARVTFAGLPEGQYTATILHDENNHEKIDVTFMLPLPSEGVGFSNYDDFGLNIRPNFKKASFNIVKDTSITIKAIYK